MPPSKESRLPRGSNNRASETVLISRPDSSEGNPLPDSSQLVQRASCDLASIYLEMVLLRRAVTGEDGCGERPKGEIVEWLDTIIFSCSEARYRLGADNCNRENVEGYLDGLRENFDCLLDAAIERVRS